MQIHVSDKLAPKVISMVGTMQNLVNEVLQAVVGNYFRDTLQGMAAVQFIENRAAVQTQAQAYIADQIRKYNVETRGVYIQDVVLPEEIVRVLTQREIANQEKATFLAQREAQLTRIDMEKQAGLADRQRDLAGSEVDITIKENGARARKAEADGEATTSSRPAGRAARNRSRRSGARERVRGAEGARGRGRRIGQRRIGAGKEHEPLRARHPG